jgi:hypothetical protein
VKRQSLRVERDCGDQERCGAKRDEKWYLYTVCARRTFNIVIQGNVNDQSAIVLDAAATAARTESNDADGALKSTELTVTASVTNNAVSVSEETNQNQRENGP